MRREAARPRQRGQAQVQGRRQPAPRGAGLAVRPPALSPPSPPPSLGSVSSRAEVGEMNEGRAVHGWNANLWHRRDTILREGNLLTPRFSRVGLTPEPARPPMEVRLEEHKTRDHSPAPHPQRSGRVLRPGLLQLPDLHRWYGYQHPLPRAGLRPAAELRGDHVRSIPPDRALLVRLRSRSFPQGHRADRVCTVPRRLWRYTFRHGRLNGRN